MFTAAGYTYKELYNTFKVQSQPEWVLGGYARAEEKYKVKFDFYLFDPAQNWLQKNTTAPNLSATKLKRQLKPFRINANDALRRSAYHNERIGHIVQVIRGIK